MPSGFNGTQTILDIPAAGSVNVLATGPLHRLTVVESTKTSTGGTNAPVGLLYKIPNDGSATGFTQTFPAAAGVPIVLGAAVSEPVAHTSLLGNGSGFIVGIGATAATTLCQVTSATGAATSIQVRQDY